MPKQCLSALVDRFAERFASFVESVDSFAVPLVSLSE